MAEINKQEEIVATENASQSKGLPETKEAKEVVESGRASQRKEPQEVSHQCSECSKVFKARPKPKHHSGAQNLNQPTFCPACSKTVLAGLIDSIKNENIGRPVTSSDSKDSQTKGRKANLKESRRFECRKCRATFRQYNIYRVHLLSHGLGHLYRCNHCGEDFRLKTFLKKHLVDCAADLPFSCTRCGAGFSFPFLLKDHLLLHSKQQPLVCFVCLSPFIGRNELEEHLLQHVGEASYGCNRCDARFVELEVLKEHLLTHKDPAQSILPNSPSSADLEDALTDEDLPKEESESAEVKGGRMLRCVQCNQDFHNHNELNDHILGHREEGDGSFEDAASEASDKEFIPSYRCPQCGDVFTSKEEIASHWASHCLEEKKQHKCPYCFKILCSASSLKRHIMTHSACKPFKCTLCPNTFDSDVLLKTHMKNHNEDWPFKCEVCQKGFKSSKALKHHQSIHTKRTNHKCLKCDAEFVFKKDLRKHKKETHAREPPPHKCPHCKRAFLKEDTLSRHLIHSHSMNPFHQCSVCNFVCEDRTKLKEHRKVHTGTSSQEISHPSASSVAAPHDQNPSYSKQDALSENQTKSSSQEEVVYSVMHLCSLCNQFFKDEAELHLHQEMHIATQALAAAQQLSKTQLENQKDEFVGKHLNEVGVLTLHQCQICMSLFKDDKSLKEHIKVQHTPAPGVKTLVIVQSPGKTSKSSKEENVLKLSPDHFIIKTLHQCSICRASFADANVLQQHAKSHCKGHEKLRDKDRSETHSVGKPMSPSEGRPKVYKGSLKEGKLKVLGKGSPASLGKGNQKASHGKDHKVQSKETQKVRGSENPKSFVDINFKSSEKNQMSLVEENSRACGMESSKDFDKGSFTAHCDGSPKTLGKAASRDEKLKTHGKGSLKGSSEYSPATFSEGSSKAFSKDRGKGNLKVTGEKDPKMHGERNSKTLDKNVKTHHMESPKSQSTRSDNIKAHADRSPKVQSHEGQKAHSRDSLKERSSSKSKISSGESIKSPSDDCPKTHGDNLKLEITDNPNIQLKDNVKAEKSGYKNASGGDSRKTHKSNSLKTNSRDNLKDLGGENSKAHRDDNRKTGRKDTSKSQCGDNPRIQNSDNLKTQSGDDPKSQIGNDPETQSCDNSVKTQSCDSSNIDSGVNSKAQSGGNPKTQNGNKSKTCSDDTHKSHGDDNSKAWVDSIPKAQSASKPNISSDGKSESECSDRMETNGADNPKNKSDVKQKTEGSHNSEALSGGNMKTEALSGGNMKTGTDLALKAVYEDENEGKQQVQSTGIPEVLAAGNSKAQSISNLTEHSSNNSKANMDANEKGCSDGNSEIQSDGNLNVHSDCNQKGHNDNNLKGKNDSNLKEQTGDNHKTEKEENKIRSYANLKSQDSGMSKQQSEGNPEKQSEENLKAHSKGDLKTISDSNKKIHSPKKLKAKSGDDMKTTSSNSPKAHSSDTPKAQSSVCPKDQAQICSNLKIHDNSNSNAESDSNCNDDSLKEKTFSNKEVETIDEPEEGKEKVQNEGKTHVVSVQVKKVQNLGHSRTGKSEQVEVESENYLYAQKNENIEKQSDSSLATQSSSNAKTLVENNADGKNIDISVQSGDKKEQNGGCMRAEGGGTIEGQIELRQQQNPQALHESPATAARLSKVQVESLEIKKAGPEVLVIDSGGQDPLGSGKDSPEQQQAEGIAKQSGGEQKECGTGALESSVKEQSTLSSRCDGEQEGELEQGVNKKLAANMSVQEKVSKIESSSGSPREELLKCPQGAGGIHSCPKCNKKFQFDHELKAHLNSHTSEKPFKCKYCWRTFMKLHIMKEHMRKHPVRKSKYKCSECGRFCGSPLALSNHKKTHRSKAERECGKCQIEFSSLSELESHKSTHMREDSYKCSKSDAIFQSKDKLSEHKVVHNNEKPFVCPVCKNTFRHSTRQPFICPICNKISKHKSSPSNHRSPRSSRSPSIHDGQGSLKCKMCNSVFKVRADLAKHYWTNHANMRHKCALCPMSFRSKGGLLKHKLLHKKDRRGKFGGAHNSKTHHQQEFSCLVCSATFATVKLLRDHREMHSEKPYKCAHCDASFWTIVGLKRHNTTHYSLSYRCTLCEKFFPSKRQLRWHQAAHNAKLHTCYMCGEEFSTMRHLTKHLQIHSDYSRPSSPVIGTRNKDESQPGSPIIGTRNKPEKYVSELGLQCLREVQILLKRIRPDDHPDVNFNIDSSQFKDEITGTPSAVISTPSKNKAQLNSDGASIRVNSDDISTSSRALKEGDAHNVNQSAFPEKKKSEMENISLDGTHKDVVVNVKGTRSSRRKDEVGQSPDPSPKKLQSGAGKIFNKKSKKDLDKKDEEQRDAESKADDHSRTYSSVEALDSPSKLGETGKEVAPEQTSSDKVHVELQVKTSSFVCPKCEAVFKHHTTFTQHLMTHKDLHKFNCSHCSASFKLRSLLKKHMLDHASELPFSCLRCEAKFSFSFLLKDHLMTHTSGPLLACFHCDAPFILAKELDEHVLLHVGREYLVCHLCGQRFPDVEILRNHVASHESGLVTKDDVQSGSCVAVKPHTEKNISGDVKACNEPTLKEKKEDTVIKSEGEVHITTDSNHNEKHQTLSQLPVEQTEPECLEHATNQTVFKAIEQSDQTVSKQEQEKTVFRRIDKKDETPKHLEHMTVFRCASPNDSVVSKMRDDPNVTVFRPIEQKGYILSKLYEDSSKTVFKCVEQPKNDPSKMKDQFRVAEQFGEATSTSDNTTVKDNKSELENVGSPGKGMELQDVKGRYKCMDCLAYVSSQEELKDHMLIHKDSGDTNIVVKADSSSSFSRYVCVNYRCPQCAEVFSTKNDLVSHWAIHCSDEDDENKCPHCGKVLSSAASLKRHMQTHKEFKTHKCPQCPKSFSSEFALKNHMMLHSKPLPFKCTHCEKQFSTASYLTSHLNTHLKERSHKCTTCSANFLYKKDLKLHMKMHMQDLPHKCTHCHKAFAMEKSLKRHLTRSHGVRSPHPCRYCGATFQEYADLKDHVRGHKPGFFSPAAVTKQHNARVGETMADYSGTQDGNKSVQTVPELYSIEGVTMISGDQRVERVSRGSGDGYITSSDQISISVRHEGENMSDDTHSEIVRTPAGNIIDHLDPASYVEDHTGPIDVIAGSPMGSILTTSHIETVVTDGHTYEDDGMIPIGHSDDALVSDGNIGGEVAITSSGEGDSAHVSCTEENLLSADTAGQSGDDYVDEVSDSGILRNALGSNVVIQSTVSLAQSSSSAKPGTAVSPRSYSRSEMKKQKLEKSPLTDQRARDIEGERKRGSNESLSVGAMDEVIQRISKNLPNKEEVRKAKEPRQKQSSRDGASFKEIKVKIMNPDGKCLESVILVPCAKESQSSHQEAVAALDSSTKEVQKRETHPCGLCKAEFSTDSELEAHFAVHLVEVKDLASFENKEDPTTHTASMSESIPSQNSVIQAVLDKGRNDVPGSYTTLVSTSHIDVSSSSHADVTLTYPDTGLISFSQEDGGEAQTSKTSISAILSSPQTHSKSHVGHTSSNTEPESRVDSLPASHASERKSLAGYADVKVASHASENGVPASHISEGKVSASQVNSGKDQARSPHEKVLASRENNNDLPANYVGEVKSPVSCSTNSQAKDSKVIAIHMPNNKVLENQAKDGKVMVIHTNDGKGSSIPIDIKATTGHTGKDSVPSYDTVPSCTASEGGSIIPTSSSDVPSTFTDNSQVSAGHSQGESIFSRHMTDLDAAVISAEGDVVKAAIEMSDAAATLASIASDIGIPSQGANVVVQTSLPQVSQEPFDIEFHGEEKPPRSQTVKRMSSDAFLDEDVAGTDFKNKRLCREGRGGIQNEGEDVIPKEENSDFSGIRNLKPQVASGEGKPADSLQNVSEFRCSECDAVFSSPESLAVHKEMHRSRVLSCNLCQAKFSTEAALKAHGALHLESLYRCSQCDVSFTKQRDLTDHMQLHKGKRSHKCLQCGKAFYSTNLLKTHMLIHARKDEFNLPSVSMIRTSHDFLYAQGSESFLSSDEPDEQHTANTEDVSVQCPQCDKVLKDAADLLYHISAHDGRKPHQCCQCDKAFKFPAELRKHLGVVHRMKDPFYCSQCSETFVSIYQLKEHMIVHRKKQKFSCTECNATFRMRSSLKKHMLYHSGERPHMCATCHLSFPSHSVLQSHIIMHTAIKPYKCSLCDKAYSRTKELRLHIMEHTGERPVKCPHCEKSVRNISALRYHLRTHEGKFPYKCPHCIKAYRLPQQLKKHLMQVHKTSNFHQCPDCSEYFVSRFKMKEHMRTHREGSHKYDQCDEEFSTGSRLELHKKSHTDQPHQCPKCESSFSFLSDLNAHMSLHKELYTCPHCASVHIDLQSFNRHVQSHVSGKLYQCVKCDQSFSLPEELKTHMTIHQTEDPSESGQSEVMTSPVGSWDSKRALSGPPFKCGFCTSFFVSLAELKVHQAVHKGCFKCPSCDVIFHEMAALSAHLQIHPSASLYQCAICDQLFNEADSLEAHVAIHNPNQNIEHSQSEAIEVSYGNEPMMGTHSEEQSIKCPQCNKLVEIGSLPQHVLLHSGDHPHECCECTEAFHLMSQLKRHLELVHKTSNPHHCSQCSRTFASFYQLRDHHLIHEEKKDYLCVDCEASFNDPGNLNQHKMYHIGEHPHKCLTCQLTFKEVSIFQGHIVGHAHEGPFHCSQCKELCLSAWDLKLHMIKHGNLQAVKCPHCPKILAGLSDLKLHLAVHRDKPQQECNMNPFQCSECLEYFASQQDLKDHERIHHKGPHQCLHCHETLLTLDELRAHKRLHSNLHPHHCSRCDSSFTHQSELQAHAAAHQDYKCAHCKESFESKEDIKKHLLMRSHNRCPSRREMSNIKGVLSPKEKSIAVEEVKESDMLREGHLEKSPVKLDSYCSTTMEMDLRVAAEEVAQIQQPGMVSPQMMQQEVGHATRERTNPVGEEHGFPKEDPCFFHPHEYCLPRDSSQVVKQEEVSTSSGCLTPAQPLERSQVYKERRRHLTQSGQGTSMHFGVGGSKDAVKDVVMFGDNDDSRNEVVIHFYE